MHSTEKSKKSLFFSKRANGKRGRPKKEEVLENRYFIEAEVDRNEEAIARDRSWLGRFVLASNDTNLEGELMLQHYKGQNNEELIKIIKLIGS